MTLIIALAIAFPLLLESKTDQLPIPRTQMTGTHLVPLNPFLKWLLGSSTRVPPPRTTHPATTMKQRMTTLKKLRMLEIHIAVRLWAMTTAQRSEGHFGLVRCILRTDASNPVGGYCYSSHSPFIVCLLPIRVEYIFRADYGKVSARRFDVVIEYVPIALELQDKVS